MKISKEQIFLNHIYICMLPLHILQAVYYCLRSIYLKAFLRSHGVQRLTMYRYMYFHCIFYRLSTLQLLVPGTEWTIPSVVVWALGPGQPPWLPPSRVAEDPDLQRPCPTGCSGIPLVQIMLSHCSLNFFDTYECIYCSHVYFSIQWISLMG